MRRAIVIASLLALSLIALGLLALHRRGDAPKAPLRLEAAPETSDAPPRTIPTPADPAPAPAHATDTTLIVHVVAAGTKRPLPGVRVIVEAARKASGSKPWPGLRRRPKGTQTDADGIARVRGLGAGRYVVHADLSPILFAELEDLTLGAADALREVTLEFPRFGTLAGRIVGAPPGTWAGFTLVTLPVGADLEAQIAARGDDSVPVAIGADGSFQTGPLEVGRTSIALGYPRWTAHEVGGGSSSNWGPSIELGEVEILADTESRAEYDLTGQLPGRIEVTLLEPRTPVVGAVAMVTRVDDPFAGAVVEFDASGHGVSGPMPPGPVRLVISGPGDRWHVYPEETWTLASAETAHAQLALPIREGWIRLVDSGTGEPLRKTTFFVSPDTPDATVADEDVLETDSNGRARIYFAPGKLRVELHLDERRREAHFNWSDTPADELRIELSPSTEPR